MTGPLDWKFAVFLIDDQSDVPLRAGKVSGSVSKGWLLLRPGACTVGADSVNCKGSKKSCDELHDGGSLSSFVWKRNTDAHGGSTRECRCVYICHCHLFHSCT